MSPRQNKSFWMLAILPALTVMIAQLTAARAEGNKEAAAVERGRALVASHACTDCHTPMKFDARLGMPVPDRDRFLSGHPAGAPVPASLTPGTGLAIGETNTSFRFPFGVVYAANLTPDETGLKGWSEEMFVKALKTGKHMGGTGRPIYPPMPWTSFRNLSEQDLRAVYAYLRTLKPVRNDVPAVEMPPPVEMAFIHVNEAIAKSAE
jgi:mono/diheme cytochrome c family protein